MQLITSIKCYHLQIKVSLISGIKSIHESLAKAGALTVHICIKKMMIIINFDYPTSMPLRFMNFS